MPEFLEKRYSTSVRTVMAIFWLGVYIFVNLTAILWLGATAVHTVAGMNVETALVALGVFAGAYALYGGLKAVALTDIVQVSLLVLGGLIITYIALNKISGQSGVIAGFHELTRRFPEKFDMILSPSNPSYKDLPGLSVLLGGMWVMNVSYWGFNQYIIQRALAAKDTREAQKGIVLAAFLKLLMPVIIVLPGIAAAASGAQSRAPGSGLPAPHGDAADGYPGTGVCGADRGHRCLDGIEDQLHRHHLHHGCVPPAAAELFPAPPGVGRPDNRRGRSVHCHRHGAAAARQL